MINQNQLIFAAVAFFVFFIILAFAYRKDKQRNKTYFKKSYLVLIAFILFIVFLSVMKIAFG